METPSQFEVPWGWTPSQFEVPFFARAKFHGGRNFDIILTLWRLQVNLKFHGGGNFDVILALWRPQVSLKFHGGGNFDIILTLWRLQVSLKFHGGGNIFIILELRNLGSCASQVAHSCASGVAQAKVRNPNCAIRLKSCAILVAQPGEVAESDFIQPQGDWT